MQVSAEEGTKFTSKHKRVTQVIPYQKQGKSLRPPERFSSNTNNLRSGTNSVVSAVQVTGADQVNLPTKLRSRRKKALILKQWKAPENTGNDRLNTFSHALHNRALDLKVE